MSNITKVIPRLVVPQPAYRLEGVRINYDLTPKETVKLLSGSNSDIANWPEELMGLWNGGKTGVVENAVLPFVWPHQQFSIAQGRQQQAPIGYVLPVEIASLVLPENDPPADPERAQRSGHLGTDCPAPER